MNVEQINLASPKECQVIWSRLKSGDKEALGELYDVYIDELLLYGISISNDKSQVMDSIHDLFVDLHHYRSNLADTDNVKYYLFTSLKRKIFKKNKKKNRFIETDYLSTSYSFKSHSKSVEENIIFSETVREKNLGLIRKLDLLTKKQRKGISLRFDQERSYKEIAQILDISVASARTTIYRAIKVLREASSILLFFF